MTVTSPSLPTVPSLPEKVSPAWDNPVTVEGVVRFATPEGAAKPRRVTTPHVLEFNAYMEMCARKFWEEVDAKKPYAVDESPFRSRYGYIAVDTGPIPA